MQPNEKRIFKTLQQVKGAGIEEFGLLGEDVTGSYARKIRSKINSALGDSSAVHTELGVWYLHEEYWDMQPVDLKELIIIREIRDLKRLIYPLTITVLLLAAILTTILVLTLDFNA